MRVRVMYALPERQTEVTLSVESGATVADALARATLADRFSELNGQNVTCAIFGKVVPLTHVLHENDRVEILRPLQVDPKESRRHAAAAARVSSRK
jgi:putative ubiquitin-RnfH superfamily antitoxin RatB of RatAB toxin-antitoxin module